MDIYILELCANTKTNCIIWNLQKAKQFAKEFNFEFGQTVPRTIYKNIWEDTREKQVGDRGRERLYWVWKV